MKTYLDYHVLNFQHGYNITLDKGGMRDIPLVWISERELAKYLNLYLDMDDNEVYIRFATMSGFMQVPKNRGEVRP
jgi:hypothetical protein